jgi:flagellar biosynthesis/type III secretory pathway M-ring protein FliF/YscJ
MDDDYLLFYIIAVVVILALKIVFWIIYWNFFRPRRLQSMRERRELLSAQQLAFQQQQLNQHRQQELFNANYPTVQTFSYEETNSSSTSDLPPSYANVVKNSNLKS